MTVRLLILSLLAPVWVSASAAGYFSAGPSGGKFPNNMHTENTGATPAESVYKNGFTAEGWSVQTVDASSYAFVAPSHSASGLAVESRLSTDPFTVESPDARLRWDAKSMLPGFPETYSVIVTDMADGVSVSVAEIDAEDCTWQTRLVSLADFAGKNISVSFVCRSVDKYMLAVRDIYAGILESGEWLISDNSNRYASVAEGAYASGTIRNIGAPMDGVSVVCRSGDLEMTQEISGTVETDSSLDYSFELPVALNECTPYIIGIKDKDGNFTRLTSSDVFTSNFVRNLVVDEGTGMWCNNCPDGILVLDKLKREYGDNIIILSCHTGNDVLALSDYWANLKFYAVPYMMLNRNHDTARGDARNFDKEYHAPTVAEIILPESVSANDGYVSVDATTRFAEGCDNSNGRYKIGYTIVADIYRPVMPFHQENSLTYPRGEQYYFLPSYIPPTLARFDNVALSEEYAFSGLEGSIPASIEAMTDYGYSFGLSLPDNAMDADNVRLVAYILDTESGIIMNAASSPVVGTTAVDQIECSSSDGPISVTVTPDRRLLVRGADNAEMLTITIADAAGRVHDKAVSSVANLPGLSLNFPEGPAIISVRTTDGRLASTKYFSL